MEHGTRQGSPVSGFLDDLEKLKNLGKGLLGDPFEDAESEEPAPVSAAARKVPTLDFACTCGLVLNFALESTPPEAAVGVVKSHLAQCSAGRRRLGG
jgi:hypothetical protein